MREAVGHRASLRLHRLRQEGRGRQAKLPLEGRARRRHQVIVNRAGPVCLGARAHSLSILGGRLRGYRRSL
jgi:hypothetical protein